MTESHAVWPDGAREAVVAAPPAGEPDEGVSSVCIEFKVDPGAPGVAYLAKCYLRRGRSLAALRAENERLTGAIRWALGEGDSDFGDQLPPGRHEEADRLRAEVARLREDGERRQAEVLQLRALLAALPIGECQASAALQGWWDQMKAVMAGTNPVWLVEPRGCPTPGACSCPGVRLDAARSARGGEG